MKKGQVVSVEGGCVPGPKKDEDHDCTTFPSSGKEICTCNKHLCNGVDLGTAMNTEKTTTTAQETNGLKNLFTRIWDEIVMKHLEI